MQPKALIIFAIVGITALAIFNLITSANTQKAIAAGQVASATASAAAPSRGGEPKATLDKASAALDSANQTANNNLATADKAAQ